MKTSATKTRTYRTFLLMRELAAQEIGARIAQARREAGGMTQEELGELLGVSTRSVQNYEAGETIPWRKFEKLSEIFNRKLGWFLHGVDGDGDATDAERLDRMEAQISAMLELLRDLRESLGSGE